MGLLQWDEISLNVVKPKCAGRRDNSVPRGSLIRGGEKLLCRQGEL